MFHRLTRRLSAPAASLILGLLASGCGSGLVLAEGKVVTSGKALEETTGPKGQLYITFTPLVEGGRAGEDRYSAKSDGRTGDFEVRGPDRKGIPPGKYRISVEFFTSPGADTLKGKFGVGRSPIVREVDGSEEIVIDIDKPRG